MSTTSRLGHPILALGTASYLVALFHSMTPSYSRALSSLGSIIHSTESVAGSYPDGGLNMAPMAGSTRDAPTTITSLYFFSR